MSKRKIFGLAGIFVMGFIMLSVTSCKKDKVATLTPSQILASTKWKTTIVKDSVGTDVTTANQGYVGFATYSENGNFEITDLAGTPRSSGTWAITADGKKRILVTSTFTRVVDIVTLTTSSFVYEITNTAGNKVRVWHEPAK